MFSKATEYALRATIFIAQKCEDDRKLSLDEIATAIDSPRPFTAKIMQLLTKDGMLVSSTRGPNGGFYLTKTARKQPIISVLKAMGEESVLDKCVLGLKMCSEIKPCPMHSEYVHVRRKLKELFHTKSIEEFAVLIDDGVVFIRH